MKTNTRVAAVLPQLRATCPPFAGVRRALAGGLSDSVVYEVVWEGRPAVLKLQRDPVENVFYRTLRFAIADASVWLPAVYAAGETGGWYWLFMEYVDAPWPTSRFNIDVEAISRLLQLHGTPVQADSFAWADQDWLPEHIDFASAYLPAPAIVNLERVYRRYRDIRDCNRVLCSGDPNPPNWRCRDNGTAVLLDWQRVSYENRALDLAGWLATMVAIDELLALARYYLPLGSLGAVRELAADIAVYFCRRCTMNFWYAKHAAQPALWREGNKRMASSFPTWLETVATDALSGIGG